VQFNKSRALGGLLIVEKTCHKINIALKDNRDDWRQISCSKLSQSV